VNLECGWDRRGNLIFHLEDVWSKENVSNLPFILIDQSGGIFAQYGKGIELVWYNAAQGPQGDD
jgi:hypothetical protein